jgi:PAS domain S-box-containing protein
VNAPKTKKELVQELEKALKRLSEVEQLEKALRESEDKYKQIFNNINAVIVRIDKYGRITEINSRAEEFFGFKPEDMLGKPFTELGIISAEDMPKMVKMFGDIFSGTQLTYHGELKTRDKDGNNKYVDVNSTIVKKDGKLDSTISIVYDITERRKAKEELQGSEENFRRTLEDSPFGVLILNSDDETIYSNRALLEIFGYDSLEEFRSIPIQARYTPESYADYLTRKDKRNRGEEKPVPVGISIRRKDGEIRYLETMRKEIFWSGKRQYQIIYQDITARRKAEEALRESEEFNSTLLTNTPNGIFVTYPDGTIKYVNPAFETLTGYSLAEIIGMKTPYPWWSKDYKDEIEASLMETTPGEGINLGEKLAKQTTFQKKNGELFTVDLNATLINKNGKREYILVSWIDITARKKAEEALKESEERFRAIFEQASDSIVLIDPKTLKIVDFNTHAHKTLGYTREEFGKLDIGDTNIFEPIEEIQKRAEVFFKGKASALETKQKTKSGEIRDVQISVKTINLGGKKLVMSIWRDITESKRAQEALKESEEKFSKAFNSSSVAICILSLPDNRFVEVNDADCRFTGYSREELVGHTTEELHLWAYPEDIKRLRDTIEKDGIFTNFEYHARMKSGEIRTGLSSSEVINIGSKPHRLIVVTDITERKRAEDALRTSEENFRHSLDDSPLGIRIVNSKGEPVYINQALLETYGYSTLEEYQSRPIEKRFTPEMYQEHLKVLQEMASNVFSSQKHGETRIVRKDGEVRLLEVLTKEILWNGEKQYQLLYRDITERRQAEDKLKQAMSNLEQSSARLAAANKELEAFSYSVSHDLRSPLRRIDGFSQALLEDYAGKLDDTGKDYLNRLRNASQKMGELIDGLLRLSRLSRSELHHEPIHLSTMAIEIATRLQETQPERIVEFIIRGDLTTEGDPQMLQALLENLLGNAWKFTAKVPHAVIEFGCKQEGAQKTFFVKDNGAGFDMTYADKLFGAFQRLHDDTDYPGTGIGLATVRRIVNRHGGTVRAEGEVGKGASFYFTLG